MSTQFVPGDSRINRAGRPRSPTFKAVIQDLPEDTKVNIVARMVLVALKGKPSDAIKAAEFLARWSAELPGVEVNTEDFTIRIAPSSAMEERGEVDLSRHAYRPGAHLEVV